MNEINSRQNVKFKTWLSLTEARGIKKSGLALISGEKLVQEFLRQNPSQAADLIYPPKAREIAAPKNVKSYSLSAPLFKSLDVLGTHAPLLCVRTPEIAEWKGGAPQGLELILALSDPGNLGALLRSAEAFGVTRVILTQESAMPFLPKTIRASSGAVLRISLCKFSLPLAEVTADSLYALDMNGTDIRQFQWPNDLYLVLGEEGRGIPPSLKTKTLTIPMARTVESLNAMVAASIALFSYRSSTL